MMYRLGVQVCNPCDIVKDWRSYHRQGLPAPPCRQPDHPSLLLFTISSPPPPLLSSQQPNNQPSSLHTSYTSHYTPLVHPHPSSSWFDVVFVRRWPRWCWLPSCSRPLCWLVSGPPLPCDPVRPHHQHLNTHIHHPSTPSLTHTHHPSFSHLQCLDGTCSTWPTLGPPSVVPVSSVAPTSP